MKDGVLTIYDGVGFADDEAQDVLVYVHVECEPSEYKGQPMHEAPGCTMYRCGHWVKGWYSGAFWHTSWRGTWGCDNCKHGAYAHSVRYLR